jgi:pimeloyl-ACP methyl ester carboxylesterase
MDGRWIKTGASLAEHRIVELTKHFSGSTTPTARMPNTKTVHVPHLGGIDASYQMPRPYDSSKPTLVLVNSFTTDSELYKSQYANKQLTDAMNLISIELLGHGQTRTKAENWTYWDTAIMNIQVLDALGMAGPGKKVFVLGTSQGGWITARMALIAPDKITGIMPLGTSMDYESERTRELGCWNGPEGLAPNIQEWTTNASNPSFQPSEDYCNFLIDIGFGKSCPAETRNFWIKQIQANYQGDEGRRRIRMAAINLKERDGLHSRLFDIRSPVLWLHGTADPVYSVKNAEEEIKMFVNSPDARVKVVEGGEHFLSFSHPEVVDGEVLGFVKQYAEGRW